VTATVRTLRRARFGISLVELLVVIAIMAVVAGMIVATASKVLAVVNQWK
jgi:prepilin-type N-terminal cleavage/methylation domain-containing protein